MKHTDIYPNPTMIIEGLQAKSKIFGIGLSRTGTSSLAQALQILGYRSIHYPPLNAIPQVLLNYDAATDTSIACCYQYLDMTFPKSKFILSVRDLKSWMISAERHFRTQQARKQWQKEIRRRLYGAEEWDALKFAAGYQRHCEGVRTYFEHRPSDFLTLNIISGEGWNPLCAFLNKAVPRQPFPKSNTSSQLNCLTAII